MSIQYNPIPSQLYLFIARPPSGFIFTFNHTWQFSYIQGVGVLNLHEFTFMFTIPFMARQTRLIMLRLNILWRQRQKLIGLIEVHIPIIIQVTRDFSNIEKIAQWPSTTWFTCSLHVRGTLTPLIAVCRESFRLTEMRKLSRKRRWFTSFIVSFSICSGVASKMNLRSIGDLGVTCSHLMSLPAKLYYRRVNRSWI